MSKKKKTGTPSRRRISPEEQARRTQQRKQRREQSIAAVEQLLYSRAQTAHALGDISIATVIRKENKKLLDKVRHTPRGEVFHRVAQVRALARGDHAE